LEKESTGLKYSQKSTEPTEKLWKGTVYWIHASHQGAAKEESMNGQFTRRVFWADRIPATGSAGIYSFNR